MIKWVTMNLVTSSTFCTLYESKPCRPFNNWVNAFAISHSLLGTKQHLVGGSIAWVPIMPNTWGLRHRTMSLGSSGLVRFPLPASRGSGHGGRTLTFPQALGWDGENKKQERTSQNIYALLPRTRKRYFQNVFGLVLPFFVVLRVGEGVNLGPHRCWANTPP